MNLKRMKKEQLIGRKIRLLDAISNGQGYTIPAGSECEIIAAHHGLNIRFKCQWRRPGRDHENTQGREIHRVNAGGRKSMSEAEQVLKRALSHEQKLNETLREKVFELETEIKTLQLKVMAKYAAQVDDN